MEQPSAGANEVSQDEIDEYLEELNHHFLRYASVRELRTELGISRTARARTHPDDRIWKAIKESVRAIMKPYNLESLPPIEDEIIIARKIARSEPLKTLCEANGKNPRHFVSWFVWNRVRNKTMVRNRKAAMHQQGGPRGHKFGGGESDREAGAGTSDHGAVAEASDRNADEEEGVPNKGLSIQSLLN
ncbi:hypothetical protein TWF696_001844 [Orbilia brochopaga]|uniref:Uncharacterized protein n=1 Tax=Orbilia brochopaga TaxID=3140254 RepID=A0AAV9U648_9PEZI